MAVFAFEVLTAKSPTYLIFQLAISPIDRTPLRLTRQHSSRQLLSQNVLNFDFGTNRAAFVVIARVSEA